MLPFQCCTRAPMTVAPTAVQPLRGPQETALNVLLELTALLSTGMTGVGWTDQLRPFQRSAKAVSPPIAPPVYPTAVHAVRDAHDTPLKELPPTTERPGALCTDHLLSFHRSARGSEVKLPSTLLLTLPTAVQASRDVQDTPSMSPFPAKRGVR